MRVVVGQYLLRRRIVKILIFVLKLIVPVPREQADFVRSAKSRITVPFLHKSNLRL